MKSPFGGTSVSMMKEFGQIPSQLFTREHPQRMPLSEVMFPLFSDILGMESMHRNNLGVISGRNKAKRKVQGSLVSQSPKRSSQGVSRLPNRSASFSSNTTRKTSFNPSLRSITVRDEGACKGFQVSVF